MKYFLNKKNCAYLYKGLCTNTLEELKCKKKLYQKPAWAFLEYREN